MVYLIQIQLESLVEYLKCDSLIHISLNRKNCFAEVEVEYIDLFYSVQLLYKI